MDGVDVAHSRTSCAFFDSTADDDDGIVVVVVVVVVDVVSWLLFFLSIGDRTRQVPRSCRRGASRRNFSESLMNNVIRDKRGRRYLDVGCPLFPRRTRTRNRVAAILVGKGPNRHRCPVSPCCLSKKRKKRVHHGRTRATCEGKLVRSSL